MSKGGVGGTIQMRERVEVRKKKSAKRQIIILGDCESTGPNKAASYLYTQGWDTC